MLRLIVFMIVVAAIFVGSPERAAGPRLDAMPDPAATAASALEAAIVASPRSALEAARLAEAARQMAQEHVAQARQALARPARP